jgi:hypothetical protein
LAHDGTNWLRLDATDWQRTQLNENALRRRSNEVSCSKTGDALNTETMLGQQVDSNAKTPTSHGLEQPSQTGAHQMSEYSVLLVVANVAKLKAQVNSQSHLKNRFST